MDWKHIPSLSALRAFEATARLGSLTRAAQELNVTHAAIAQHVRALETDFGTALLTRQGRGMAPTPDGAALAQDLGESFGTIHKAVRALKDRTRGRPLTVSVTYTFAERWLMPRLPGFWRAHPEVEISIAPSERLVDMRRDGFDLAIRHGDGRWPGLDVDYLTSANLILVGTPELGVPPVDTDLSRLEGVTILLDETHPESLSWLKLHGLDTDRVTCRKSATFAMVISALTAGGGLAAITRAAAQDDLASGRLVTIFDPLGDGPGYWLVTPKGVGHPQTRVFTRWLRRQVVAPVPR